MGMFNTLCYCFFLFSSKNFTWINSKHHLILYFILDASFYGRVIFSVYSIVKWTQKYRHWLNAYGMITNYATILQCVLFILIIFSTFYVLRSNTAWWLWVPVLESQKLGFEDLTLPLVNCLVMDKFFVNIVT